jgi:RNA polymerase sigma factor (sigma-70 family)
MADAQLGSVVRYLRLVAAHSDASALTDAQLLQRFVDGRDQAAFEVLVWRHGPLVLGACQKLLAHEQDAEDAFQATFMTLARKSRSIASGAALPGWLFQVACRIALRLRGQAVRRKRRERDDVEMAEFPERNRSQDELVRGELLRAVIEELYRLPDSYRQPIIACYLQGKTHAQASKDLRKPRGSMSAVLARGCELLNARLSRRGIGLSVGALALMLGDGARAAASSAQVLPAVTAALQFSIGAAVASRAENLAKGAITTMVLNNLKVGAGVLLVVGLLAGAAGSRSIFATSAAETIHASAPETSAGEQPKALLDGNRIPKTTWEYKTLNKTDIAQLTRSAVMRTEQRKLEDGLNALGNESWELSGIESDYQQMAVGIGATKSIYVFKREKR